MSAIPEPEQRLTKTEMEAALAAFGPADWQRAKTIATAMCKGLNGWTPDDLLQEVLVKLLDGTRVWPSGVHPLVVLKTAMHSIASNARKHEDASPIDDDVALDPHEADADDATPVVHSKSTVTPEDQTSGKQQLAALYAALGGDAELEFVVLAWANGLRGAEAREELGWDDKRYDAARNRLQRRLAALDPDRRPK